MLLQRFIMSACLMGAYTAGIILGGPQEATFNAVGSDGLVAFNNCNGNSKESFSCDSISSLCSVQAGDSYEEIYPESGGTLYLKYFAKINDACYDAAWAAWRRKLCRGQILDNGSTNCIPTNKPVDF